MRTIFKKNYKNKYLCRGKCTGWSPQYFKNYQRNLMGFLLKKPLESKNHDITDGLFFTHNYIEFCCPDLQITGFLCWFRCKNSKPNLFRFKYYATGV